MHPPLNLEGIETFDQQAFNQPERELPKEANVLDNIDTLDPATPLGTGGTVLDGGEPLGCRSWRSVTVAGCWATQML